MTEGGRRDGRAGPLRAGWGGRRSRRAFAQAAAGVGAALVGGQLSVAAAAADRPSPARDRQIFRFALQLESLQEAFYRDTLHRDRLRGELREFAEVVAEHELAHVQAVARAAARPAPHARFDFRGATTSGKRFARAASLLEDLGVDAYNGAVSNLTAQAMSLAFEIVSVEGRHAAWIRDLAGTPPAPRPVDAGISAAAAAAAINALGFRKRP